MKSAYRWNWWVVIVHTTHEFWNEKMEETTKSVIFIIFVEY